ncbi:MULTISPECIES: hypothetical protein [unclassified Psychrobacillus]|uniref:hypothetical protein n=1 Tax=unclassified Psychrobacillus TaxID=2636677 RepID=UPI0030FC7BE2
MFSLFKSNKISEPNYELIAKTAFTTQNMFVDCIQDIAEWSPKQSKILNWIKQIEEDPTHSEWFYLHQIRSNKEVFHLNTKTMDYVKTLLNTNYLIGKCKSIIYSDSKPASEYLVAKLVDVVYLLQEVDSSLRKGVPLHHQSIVEAVTVIYQLLEEKMNEYFQLNTESLTREVQIAKQLRVEYQERKADFILQAKYN